MSLQDIKSEARTLSFNKHKVTYICLTTSVDDIDT